jgi:flagellar motor switch protein FliN
MPAGTTLQHFVDTFRKAIGEACSKTFASAWAVAIDDEENGSPSSASPLVCFQSQLSGGLQGNLALQMRSADALRMAQTLLSQPSDISAELKQDHKEAIEKLLRRIAKLVVPSLTGTFGEINLDLRSADLPAWEGISFTLRASESSVGSLPLTLRLSSELCATLSATPPADVPLQTSSGGNQAVAASDANFGRLLGVNLNLRLRFGQCVLPTQVILDMNSGSVIELDREVHRPADLLLGDKVIARGEVVLVDGNYGLRVTEVVDVRQRLVTI